MYKKSNALNAWFCVEALTFFGHGEMTQEGVHFVRAHRRRVLLAMKKDVPPDPHYVRFLGTRAVMADSNGSSYTIQKFRRVAHRTEVPSAAMERQEIHFL